VVNFSASESTIGVVVTGRVKRQPGDEAEADSPKPQGMSRASTFRRLGSVSSVGSMSKFLSRQGSMASVSSTGTGTKQGALEHASSTVVREWRGRPVAIMVDRNDNGWVAVEMLLTHQEAQQRGLAVSQNFDKRHQLLRPLRTYVRMDIHKKLHLTELDMYDGEAAALFDKYIRWVPIHTIDRTFALNLVMTQEEIDSKLNVTSNIALRNTFFVEHGDVES